MSSIVRFVLRIDDDWLATIECPDAAEAWAATGVSPRQLTKLKVGNSTLPAPVTDLHDPLPDEVDSAPTAAANEQLAQAFASVVGRNNAQVARFGHYLFHAAIGWTTWAYMNQVAEAAGASAIELAIAVPSRDPDLQRLNWELMHSGKAFLAAGMKLRVAITRQVVSDVQPPDPLVSPPRYLWVIGTSLTDERIRPGAELMGLLRHVKGRRPINSRILERASPAKLHETMEEFDPEIVHFVCHGNIDEQGIPSLELRQDDDRALSRRTADQLIVDLQRSGPRPRYPTVVILSACDTGSGGGTERYVLGPGQMAPMAVTLIEAGVPIVVGMSGRVGDRTCRLFTRQFGAAVISGETLVDAVAIARRAAFAELEPPPTSVDWALPTLYLADNVTANYVPIPADSDDMLWLAIDGWIRDSRLTEAPVFCGRQSYFPTFRRLYWAPRARVPDFQVLAIKAASRGLGSKRLLQELAISAIWDGRLPVLVNAPDRDKPGKWRDFVTALWNAIHWSPLRADGPRQNLQLGALLDLNSGLSDPIAQLVRAASGRALHPRPVAEALQSDLEDLVQDAKAAHPHFDRPDAQAIVLLDDIDRWNAKVAQNLFETSNNIWEPMLGDFGFGSNEQPVPVVLSFSPTEPLEGVLNDIGAQELSKTWLNLIELGPFEPGEDILAYRWVLLNPTRTMPGRIYSSPWTFADLAPDRLAVAEARFRTGVNGIPSELALATGALYRTAQEAKDAEELVSADDEAALAMVLQGKRP